MPYRQVQARRCPRRPRRIAVRAQLLDAAQPTDLIAVEEQLTLLQIDPTAVIAPAAELVDWSRLGSAYSPPTLKQALEQGRTLFELDALVRPMSDLGLFVPSGVFYSFNESYAKRPGRLVVLTRSQLEHVLAAS